MAITGTIPLSKVQGDLEATRGSAQTATRVLPILSGTLTEHREEYRVVEQRASLIEGYYPPVRVKTWVEIEMEVAPTWEDYIWYSQVGLKGHATAGTALAASTVLSTVSRYTFAPAAASAVTQSATLEVGDDTQAFIVTGATIDRFEFGWSLGGPATLKLHWLAFQAVNGSYTAALAPEGLEVINGSLAKAYIDSSTVGSTIVTGPSDFTFSIDNKIRQFWAPNGANVPTDFYHYEPRSVHAESTIRHVADTENAAFKAQTLRKIRNTIEGSEISGSTGPVNRKITWDWYGYWSEAPFTDADGLNAQRFAGDSVYNSTATHDWTCVVDCADAAIA